MGTANTDRLLRLSEVQSRTELGRSSIYRKMRDGSFPEPLKVGVRAVGWRPAPGLPATDRPEEAVGAVT